MLQDRYAENSAASSKAAGPPAGQRLDSVDLLRGAVMVIMALDHVRGYFSNARFDPVDLSQTTAALFLTRWVTHFCAPVFVFLAGTGAYLSLLRGKTKPQLAWFLLTRGLWLMLLEATVVRFGMSFDLKYEGIGLAVIWAIGCSMVVLAGLVFLPTSLVAALGLVVIAGHNALDHLRAADLGALGPLWAIVHSGEPVPVWGTVKVYPAYPIGPWIGVMAVGYALGAVLRLDRPLRRKLLVAIGVTLIVAFVALRATNAYGDPKPWSQQQTGLFTLFAFINCHKYPPSLLFLLMTLGPAIAALGLLDQEPRPRSDPLARCFITFGRVPLFYYVVHFYLIHGLARVVGYLRYGSAAASLTRVPDDWGYDLPVVYAIWLALVLLLYPICAWYAGVKRRHPGGWLSYL
jgi:uncharacterized membrane protein